MLAFTPPGNGRGRVLPALSATRGLGKGDVAVVGLRGHHTHL